VNEADLLASICRLLSKDEKDSARSILSKQWPFGPAAASGRLYSDTQALSIFRRDGFLCRYSGQRLVFPGTLRLLSVLLPHEFPFHPNWKMSETHQAYWLLCPTVDHVVPVARGGRDNESNWVTTSQLRNSAKSNWLLDDLGWKLLPLGDARAWDGLSDWFLEFVETNPELLKHVPVRRWRNVLRRAV
jgi:hypothetical protein